MLEMSRVDFMLGVLSSLVATVLFECRVYLANALLKPSLRLVTETNGKKPPIRLASLGLVVPPTLFFLVMTLPPTVLAPSEPYPTFVVVHFSGLSHIGVIADEDGYYRLPNRESSKAIFSDDVLRKIDSFRRPR